MGSIGSKALSDDEIQAAYEKAAPTDNNGGQLGLGADELKDFLMGLLTGSGKRPTEREVTALIESVDTSGDGRLQVSSIILCPASLTFTNHQRYNIHS